MLIFQWCTSEINKIWQVSKQCQTVEGVYLVLFLSDVFGLQVLPGLFTRDMTRKRLLPRMLKYYKELKAMVETTVFRGCCFCLQVYVFFLFVSTLFCFHRVYLVFFCLLFNVLLPPVLTYFLVNHFSFWIECFCFSCLNVICSRICVYTLFLRCHSLLFLGFCF